MPNNDHNLNLKPSPSQSFKQVQLLDALLYDAAIALRAELSKDGQMKLTRNDAAAVAMLFKAWDTAADRLRVLKGLGMPASVKAKVRASVQPEPLEPV